MTIRPLPGTTRRPARRLARLAPALALLLAAPLAGCGDQSDDGDTADDAATDTTSPSTSTADPTEPAGEPFAVDKPWVARFETGGDEVSDGVAYVRFDPSSGTTKVTKITGPPADFEPNPYLLVDASRSVAVRANASSIKEERTGTLTLYPLDGGKARAVDLRAVTGMQGLHPLGWAFDPEQAGLLRVLDRTGRFFEWDVDQKKATEVDEVEVTPGHALAPYFDGANGMPLLRDKKTYEVAKSGAYTAGGAQVVKTDRSACPAGTTLASTVLDSAGTAWGGCLISSKVRLFQRPDGATAWQAAGASSADVPRGTMTLSWVLPTVA